jgi:DNA (cytosine-5)-methyltransferase 1
MVQILDLYCGMGGLSLGFALALRDAEVTGLDIDRDAVGTYNLNLNRLGCRALIQDVLRWSPSGDYDVVVGGSPCNPFSIANNRKPGERHPLFPTFPRFFDVVLALKPKVFLLENVRGLLMRRNRHYLEQQLARISRDYVVEWRVLNAVDYGVPQRRERLIVIGVRRDLGRRPLFPEPTHAEKEAVTLSGRRLHRWLTLREAIGDLLLVSPQEGKKLVPVETPHELRFVLLRREQAERIRREREEPDLHGHWGKMGFPDDLGKPSRTLSSHTIEGTKRETIVVPLIPDHVMTPEGGWDNPRSDWGSRVMDPDKPAYTITEKHRSGQLVPVPPTTPETMARPSPSLVADARIYATGRREHGSDTEKGCYRRLTVRECLRIQGFPNWWRFPDHVSVSKRYRLVGEAVPPILAYRLAVAIARVLGAETREPPREEEWQLPYFRRAFADYFG